jgi:hypothetical protein
MSINEIIDYMNNKNYHDRGKRIYINGVSLLDIQKILCKILKECYIYTEMKQDINTSFQIYKNNLFGFIKQNNNMLYIWKIK